jgi:hypothetical protein
VQDEFNLEGETGAKTRYPPIGSKGSSTSLTGEGSLPDGKIMDFSAGERRIIDSNGDRLIDPRRVVVARVFSNPFLFIRRILCKL